MSVLHGRGGTLIEVRRDRSRSDPCLTTHEEAESPFLLCRVLL